VAVVAAGALTRTEAHSAQLMNAVAAENQRTGSRGWAMRPAPKGAIEGYASEISVAPGESLHLHVSTRAAASYRVAIYRIGWYKGAGGRLMGCVPGCVADRRGSPQPVTAPNPTTGLLRLTWPVTDEIRVGDGWPSGYYLANLALTRGRLAGRGSWVPFVVRATPKVEATILVQAAVTTWQAYNTWGGRSLYWNHTGVGDDHVSFDRPYAQSGAPSSAGSFANLPQAWEFPLVRFLERYGYDVAYTTDVDTDRDPTELLRHKLVMTAGHDEYWTKTMRDAFERARDSGVNLAFMGANTAYWQMRLEDGGRTIVEYRTGDRDPEPSSALKTVRFRDLQPARPECTLLGVRSLGIGSGDYTAVAAAYTPPDPWFKGTGFTASSVLPGLVGYEYDSLATDCITPTPTVLFHYAARNNPNADAVRSIAPSGARVFASGSIRFATGLDPLRGRGDRRLQRFMRNALADLRRHH
jgi:N,N-dimethylformamidase beta subunit-like protein